jgi:hypothetical protein
MNMWKLTIEQKRQSEFVEGTIPERLVVFSEELSELTMLIERITHCAVNCETSYKLEKEGDN